MSKKKIFLTGATGLMGWQSLQEFLKYPEEYDVTILVRKSKKNVKKIAKIVDKVNVIWGDLLNYQDVLNGVTGNDYVLHLGGMVSPQADYFPEKTLKTNVSAAENIAKAVLAQPNSYDIKVVYIGSVAQTSNRKIPFHWGRVGDPQCASKFDFYGLSKIKAERIIADSGIKHWVSLRQSGILYPGILKNFDPIMFHVPLRGMLEWTTIEDSGILMEHVCRDSVPDHFWNNFYNISSGAQYRMTNYNMEQRVLKAASCPPPEKIFELKWFATRNFHGQYYLDADVLDDFLHFRQNIPLDTYFENLERQLPKFFKLAKIAPPFIIKLVLKRLANTKDYGTQYWIKTNDVNRIKAFFGSLEDYNAIPDWKDFDVSEPPDYEHSTHLDHGYDETKSLEQMSLSDLQQAAQFRGGSLVSDDYDGKPYTMLNWRCVCGHQFEASPNLVLKGGHWCDECLKNYWNDDSLASKSPFFAQISK